MTDIIIDQDKAKNLFLEVALEIKSNLSKEQQNAVEMVTKRMLQTPALAVPYKDIVYLHGKIPEDYLEMVLTHEILHITVQKLCGYSHENPDTKKKHWDSVVDHPIFNMLLCLSFNVKPLKFVKWLHLASTNSWTGKLIFRIIYLATKNTYEYFIDLAKKLWGE